MRRTLAPVGFALILAAGMVAWSSAAVEFGAFDDPEQRRWGRFFRGNNDDSSSDDDSGGGQGNRRNRAFRDIIGSVEILGCAGATGVDVYIAGRSFFVRTGSTGRFQLSDVPTGTYEVVIEAPGEDPVVLAGIAVGPPAQVVDLGVISLPGPDLQNDVDNCGTCGLACAAGESCEAGVCTEPGPSCGPGEEACGPFGCVDINSDPANCGACGVACGPDDVCSNGACQPAGPSCAPNETICGGSCVNTLNDPSNCGACGNACQAGEFCSGGACQAGPGVCQDGEVQSDGGCFAQVCVGGQFVTQQLPPGAACDATGAPGTCNTNGQCEPTACTPQCFGRSCGPDGCGGVCGPGCSAGEACNPFGQCQAVATCPPGQTECNGVCVNTLTNAANCGACGNQCPAGQVCTSGACTIGFPD